jgi:hypothetical protein
MRSWLRLTRGISSSCLLTGGVWLLVSCASAPPKTNAPPSGPSAPGSAVEPAQTSNLFHFNDSLKSFPPSYLAPSWYCRWIAPGAANVPELKTALLERAEQDSRWATRARDLFAWNTFLAINWPSSTVKPSVATTNTYVPGWAAYPRRDELPQVYEPSPRRAWRCEGTCLETDLPGEGKRTDSTDALTDQNGQNVYYEVRANAPTGQVINAYWKQGFTSPTVVTFQDGQCKSGGDQFDFAPALELKLVWKVLEPKKDDPGRFFVQEKVLLPGKGPARRVDLGLVSMHIAAKVKTRDWIAMTFEHVDNVPLESSAEERQRAWSFYNPACKTAGGTPCPTNVPAPGTQPEQVTRTVPIDPDTQALTQEVHQWLQGQKGLWPGWRYYQLVGSQELHPVTRQPTPAILRNTLIETYLPATSLTETVAQQVDTRPRASSCLGCHLRSQAQDFSFLIGEALGWPQTRN